ncbi:MAG: hypothetical protein AB1609_05000 [Bacillota bacterium]
MTRSGRTVVIRLGIALGAALLAAGAAGAMGWLGGYGPGRAGGPGGLPGAWGGGMPYGMMGPGMMGYGARGPGVMGGWRAPEPAAGATPLTAEQVAEQVRAILPQWAEAGLRVGHIMEFDNGFYVIVEGAGGKGAFELLVDRYGAWVHPEPGPNMMWNTRYGHMGSWQAATGKPPVSAEQAVRQAQAYLDRSMPGTTAGELTEFPGYYTIDVMTGGRTSGMLSVNAYTGQVWYHTWHGAFLSETEADGEHEAGRST